MYGCLYKDTWLVSSTLHLNFKICWSDSSWFSFNPQHNTNEYQYKQLKTDRASSLQQMTPNRLCLCFHQKFCRHIEEGQHVTSEQSFFSMHLCSTQSIWHAPCLLAACFPQLLYLLFITFGIINALTTIRTSVHRYRRIKNAQRTLTPHGNSGYYSIRNHDSNESRVWQFFYNLNHACVQRSHLFSCRSKFTRNTIRNCSIFCTACKSIQTIV